MAWANISFVLRVNWLREIIPRKQCTLTQFTLQNSYESSNDPYAVSSCGNDDQCPNNMSDWRKVENLKEQSQTQQREFGDAKHFTFQ